MIANEEVKFKKSKLNYTKPLRHKISRDLHEKILNLEFSLSKEYNSSDINELVLLLKVN